VAVVVIAVAAPLPPPPPPPPHQSEFASLHQNDDMLSLTISMYQLSPHSCSSFLCDLTYLHTSPAYFSCVTRFVKFIPFLAFAVVRNNFH